MSYFDMEELDLIENLQRRGIDHITEKIFGYLDFYCLKRAELVSEVWNKAILDGKLWENLFYKNITLLPNWRKIIYALKGMKHDGLTEIQSSVGYHRKWCCLIESELELLESNWSKARYLEENVQVEGLSWFLEMNGDWIFHGPYWNTIAVRNRWTLELEKTLEIPITQIEDKIGKYPRIYLVKVNDSFIVAAFKEHSELVVWSTKTKDLQVVISDDKCLRRFEREETIYCDGLYLFRNLILTCHYRISDNSWIFKLKEIPKDVEERVIYLYQKTITCSPVGVFRTLAMDETYIVISLDYHNLPSRPSHLQIRKTISLEIINSFPFEDEIFDNHNGLIVTGLQEKCRPMRLWNVVTGQCVREIIADQHLTDIRFISDKFIVTCDDWGKLKIWDLAALKNTNHESNSKLLLQTIPSPVHSSSRLRPRPYTTYIIADELQTVIVFDFHINDRDASCILYSKTFLGVPKV